MAINPGITGALETLCLADHPKFERLLADVVALSLGDRRVETAKRFGEFRSGYETHALREVEVVFPLFVESSPAWAEPILKLREDHRRLHRLSNETATAISHWDPAAFFRLLVTLRGELRVHDLHERNALFPDAK